ncbi:MAG: class I SAM-dependent methyltransferase [Kordiimonadaceae bacterium]|nr:class I SAM-dependent methyltransferase [Kordiimonadaceae bacterium]MBO6567456.1 class I SAM-dependent methyltransferase [Kordiimonadaceae bacterium]MBO6963330.1 class I SAM-dependent methyltransferase [Kordiimonadaceae bacterium]
MTKTSSSLPPAWHHVEQHDMFPEHDHDDVARFNFIASMNKYLSQTLGAGNELSYEKRVLPALQKELRREPRSRHEIREAMNRDPYHRIWSAAKRNTMEQRQQISRSIVLPQADALAEKAADLIEAAGNLELDPALEIPPYIKSVDHHCMPGSYHTELVDDDVSAGANYDMGMFATTGGAMGKLTDMAGCAVVDWLRDEYPNFKPKRILDIGCTIGHTVLPIAAAFPEAEVIAIDVAAPVLRYAAARAAALGINNVRFVQASGEDLSRFDDESFDMVYTSMFLHETSNSAISIIMNQIYRVLAPSGLSLHLEQPSYTDEMPLYEQFIRDWDAHNNNEPFWSRLHDTSIHGEMQASGFAASDLFVAKVASASVTEGPEDHGRGAAWHAYGAIKGE